MKYYPIKSRVLSWGFEMFKPDLKEALELAAEYSVIPVSREIYADIITPIQALRAVRSISSRCYLLESVEGGEKWGRYSFIGFDPLIEVKCKDGVLNINNGTSVTQETKDPASAVRKILGEYKSPRLPFLPPFTGGFVGYFAYDYVKYTEPKLKFSSTDDTGFADMDLMLFDKVVAFDHLRQKITVIINVKSRELETAYNKAALDIDNLINMIKTHVSGSFVPGKLLSPFKAEMDEGEYGEMVEKIKHFIREGDIFQAVPSNRLEASFEGSLFNTYRVLRTTNPSPYMFYLKFGDMEITGASPETLIKLKDGELSTYPIAGTKPRGATDEEDRLIEESLLKDEKELSEHNMLVDLGRNDLGRISKFGSVKVKDYMKVQKYSYVMHITSVVTGVIGEGLDALDAINATLPAGTLSGAPKIRAMEIIDGLEKSRRGIYGGAIGYIDFTGNMDVCIGIRMCVKKDNKVYVRSGGGVVAASDPASEYRESANKAKAVIEALELSREVLD